MSISQDTSAPGADPGCGDKRRLRKTKTPGVFKRVDSEGRTIGYVSVFRSLLELLAATGIRISEAIALQRLHLQLDPEEPEVCIRRAIVRDRIVPPKSKYGRREVRLPTHLEVELRAHFVAQPDRESIAFAFPSEAGGSLDPGNLRRRVLKPLVEEVDAPWAGSTRSATPSPRSTSAKAPTSSS